MEFSEIVDKSSTQGELDENDLDNVAGGFIGTAAAIVIGTAVVYATYKAGKKYKLW